MPSFIQRTFLLLLGILLFATPAFSWGEAGHTITNEAATLALPNDMPPFFYQSFPELIWLGNDPDRWRSSGESIDAANSPDHFMDYEYAAGLELPPDRMKFAALLVSSGTLRRHGITLGEVGFMPWRIAELEETLTGQFRRWRTLPPRSTERRFLERDIIHTAGILGHFAGDSGNPHHATVNFNGWVDPNPQNYAIDCDAHTRFERDYVSHFMTVADATARMSPAKLITAPFLAAIAAVKSANEDVETLYRIDRAGELDLFRPAVPEAKAFTARRLAAGASLLRDLWWSAWKQSAQPRKRPATDD